VKTTTSFCSAAALARRGYRHEVTSLLTGTRRVQGFQRAMTAQLCPEPGTADVAFRLRPSAPIHTPGFLEPGGPPV